MSLMSYLGHITSFMISTLRPRQFDGEVGKIHHTGKVDDTSFWSSKFIDWPGRYTGDSLDMVMTKRSFDLIIHISCETATQNSVAGYNTIDIDEIDIESSLALVLA